MSRLGLESLDSPFLWNRTGWELCFSSQGSVPPFIIYRLSPSYWNSLLFVCMITINLFLLSQRFNTAFFLSWVFSSRDLIDWVFSCRFLIKFLVNLICWYCALGELVKLNIPPHTNLWIIKTEIRCTDLSGAKCSVLLRG